MKPEKPTEMQIATALKIAAKLGRSIPQQALDSELVMRMWTKSVLGLLSEKEQREVSKPKRYEQLLTAITWYQKESDSEKLLCPIDGVLLEGSHVYGQASLQCPACGFRLRQLPPQIFKQDSVKSFMKDQDVEMENARK